MFFDSHQETIEEQFLKSHQNPEILFVSKVGQKLLWNGCQLEIINPGQTQTALKTDEGKVIQILNQELSNLVRTGAISVVAWGEGKTKQIKQLLEKASSEACAEANRRYQIIEPYLSGDKPSINREVSIRTIQRWLSQWNQAEQLYGSGYVGLLPRVSQKGNRKQKLPPLTHRLMAECIQYDYETYKQKSKRAVYGALVNACERENTAVPSYKTFLKYCNNRPTYEQTKKRQGSRSAYSNEPFYWEARIHYSKTWRASLGYLPFRPYSARY